MRDVIIQEQMYDDNEDFADILYEEVSNISIEKESYYKWLEQRVETSIKR